MTNPIKKNADKISKLVAIAVVALFVFSACSDDNDNNTLNFNGKLVGHSECKNENSFLSDEVPANVSQVDFTFDNATNKLTLKHFNVEFNCCPDYLYTDVSLVNDTILIQEFESVATPCRCNCLYDLDILVTGVEAKKYTIKIVEPYYSGEQKIIFDVDLNEIKNGSFSVARE